MQRLGAMCLVLAAACFDPTLVTGDAATGAADARPGDAGGGGGRVAVAELPAAPTRQLDLLFVIDNSNSMGEEQLSLTTAFPELVGELDDGAGGLPDLHLGVVSSDLGIGGFVAGDCQGAGDDGLLQNAPRRNCDAPDGRYLVDVAEGSGRDRNYTGSLGDAFACIAELGDRGCGIEQHLAAMKRALDGSRPENAGFLRPGSFLGVIILADEDDCSASNPLLFDPSFELDDIDSIYGNFTSFRCTEFGVTCDGQTLPRTSGSYASCRSRADSPYLYAPAVHADFLRSLRPPTHLFVASVAGPSSPFAVRMSNDRPLLEPSCTSASGEADPAVRLNELTAGFGDHGAQVSICSDDLRARMAGVGRQLGTLLAGDCLWRPVRDVSSSGGVQPDCELFQESGEARTRVPACGGGAGQPCFELLADATRCPHGPQNLRLAVQRQAPAPPGATYVLECLP
jgi:hypothetical protein